MMTLRRIEPFSLAKTAAVVYGGLGLVIGGCVSLFAIAGSAFFSAAERSPLPFGGLFLGVGAIVFFPLLYAFFGFLGALIGSSIFNLAARWTGGVELDLR
ncbi:MAG: hypothetical protein U0X73_09400 [Thermoanaerobaculia bacterium]